MTRPTELIRRPEAKVESVEDLAAKVLRGEVRVPRFQRGLAWGSKEVLDLFDSIYQGFPIGSLLLRKAGARAELVPIGPLQIPGEEIGNALWVIDGQQRLTALTVGLGRPVPLPTMPVDPYVVYLDPMDQAFKAPPKDGNVPTRWVPLPHLLNAAELSEWIYRWPHSSESELRTVVFEAGKRLREYKVPLYIIETQDEERLRTIFYRVNNSGKPLSWSEVHDALYGHKGTEPSSLSELADRLEDVGMGRPDEQEQLLPCLVAFRGLDITRSFGEHLRADPKAFDGVVAAALPVLREVLGFLRARATIPHLRLLPYSTPLIVLTRFFKEHPEPSDRSLTLLVRWVWRTFLDPVRDDRVLKRRGVMAVTEDEEASVQELLALVPPRPWDERLFPNTFDARSAESRIVLLAMTALVPRHLDGTPVDVAALINEYDVKAFRPLFPPTNGIQIPANRILLPGTGSAREELRHFIEAQGTDHEILRSHAITPVTAEAILANNIGEALVQRTTFLDQKVMDTGYRFAEWDHTDRPSIDYLLRLAADGVEA